VFGAFSQLDALAWAAARVAALEGPLPPAPSSDDADGDDGDSTPDAKGWRVLRLARGPGADHGWKSALLRAPAMAGFRRAFVADMARNLQPPAAAGGRGKDGSSSSSSASDKKEGDDDDDGDAEDDTEIDAAAAGGD
jgi:hypothetical protein